MPYTQTEIQTGLRKKLTTRNGGEEVFSAILSGAVLFIVAMAALATSGGLSFALWTVAVIQVLGFLIRASGWRSITLRNDEQDWLKRNYKL